MCCLANRTSEDATAGSGLTLGLIAGYGLELRAYPSRATNAESPVTGMANSA